MSRNSRSWPRWKPDSITGRSPRVAKIRRAVAKSVMGEFVSGNYFRTFGLQPVAGRFFTDADDTKGAAFTAVMSYDTWAHDYASDPSHHRQHLPHQHAAGDHHRHRTEGLLW